MKNVLFIFLIFWLNSIQAQTPTGALMRWHKITLSFTGPNTSETAMINPFTDYRLDVTFTHAATNTSHVVPGFYSGCANPADTGCDSGTVWKVHFAPAYTGNWNWSASFTTGTDVAVDGGGTSAGFMDGNSGSFVIAESDKVGRDHRSILHGKTTYVGEHYLRYAGTNPAAPNGDWFIKAGADAPENTLAYDDFDNTPNRGGFRKNWNPHQQDYVASDASSYTWDNGKGTELLGVINYLYTKGMNAFSFLTFSLHGDDDNVFPHLLQVNESTYNNYSDQEQWNLGVYKDRFDVSKLAQWERIFEYADKKGMFMHFKTMETENDNLMDNDTFGSERKIYYRELIARFGHHLALNWNIAEESTLQDEVAIATSNYINQLDPYKHLIVMHTFPYQQDAGYTPLLGTNSDLTGASIQMHKNDIHDYIRTWVNNSANAGKKWVVANDEQGNQDVGVDIDPYDNKLVRDKVLWATLLAGGAGVEYYYGYDTEATDLDAQDHRYRDTKYTEANYALEFFNAYLQKELPNMVSLDNLTSDTDDYVFGKANELYVVYRPNGGTTAINLPTGNWVVNWFNPRTGGSLSAETAITSTLTAPDSEDWVALIKLSLKISPKIYLQGNTLNSTIASDGLMRDDLRISNYIPLNTPYTDNVAIDNNVLTVTGADAIVDWIWVELRNVSTNTIVIDGKSALLQRDGDVVDLDGNSPVVFNKLSGNYYVVIKHRNHLGIMSNNTIALDNTNTTVDFTNGSIPTFGINAQTISGLPNGTFAMWTGDANTDSIIQYVGESQDISNILSEVLNDETNHSNLPTFIATGYSNSDINMDGSIQYAGGGAETPLILQNILANPGNFLNLSTWTIDAQLPSSTTNRTYHTLNFKY
ncbi:MAG: DUF5060 domain-containing protein [Bacteroidota bacterium]